MPLQYSTQAGYLATALRLSNTVVPLVMQRPEFWVFNILHLVVFGAFRHGYLVGADHRGSTLCLGWNEMKVIAAVTTFFEVFYTNQCYSRYNELYSLSRKMLGNLYDFSFELRLHLRNTTHNHVRLAARWFAAAVLLFFYETNCEVSERKWEELLRLGLVHPSEKDFLFGLHRHQRSLVLLQWSAEVCRDGCGLAKTPANVLKGMVDKLLKSRLLEQEMVDMINLPMPFQYFHLLNMMVVLNLLMWAYGMATSESIFAPVIFFFANLIFMGMLELASCLSDPFGDDEVDFPVVLWLDEFLESTISLIELVCPLTLEQRLANEEPLRHGQRHLKLFMVENLKGHPDHHDHSPHHSPRRSSRLRLSDQASDSEESDDGDDD